MMVIEPQSDQTPSSDQPASPAAVVASAGGGPASRRTALVVWLALTAGFTLFLGLASVTVEAGQAPGRTSRVTRLWSRLTDELPEIGSVAAVQAVVFGALVLFVAGAILGLWLALTAESVTDGAPSPPSDRG